MKEFIINTIIFAVSLCVVLFVSIQMSISLDASQLEKFEHASHGVSMALFGVLCLFVILGVVSNAISKKKEQLE